MLDDPTVNGTGKELDVSRQQLDDRVGHASVSLYQLLGAPPCTKVSVERVFGYTTMDPRVNMPQKCIFDDLAVANFLELQHVIDVLCKWIARVIKQQQTVGELKEHFEMSGIVQYTAEGSTTHPTGLFSQLPADFWVLSLFTILPNSKQDMMYETCDAFRCFVQEYHKMPKTFVNLYAFKTVQGPKESKGIEILLKQMETIGKKREKIARKWVDDCLGDPHLLPPSLSACVGKVLQKEVEFDYLTQSALDDGIAHRFTVIEIIQERQPEADFVEKILGLQPNQLTPATPQQKDTVVEAVMTRIDEARNKAVAFLIYKRRRTNSIRQRIDTVLKRMTRGQSDTSHSDLEECLGQPSQSKGSTRSIGVRKRQKTRGRGVSGDGEMRARALELREDLRTFPVFLSMTPTLFRSRSLACAPRLSAFSQKCIGS